MRFCRKFNPLLACVGLSFHASAFSASQCGESWVFTQGKYERYYGELYRKNEAYRKECQQHGSMSDARFRCDRKVHEWYEQNHAAIKAKEEADGRAHDARRDQCLKREKDNYERQQAYNRHAEQAQRNAQIQAEQQRQQFNAELERSNAEREAYNRAAIERAEKQQIENQRQEEAAAQFRAEQQRQAEARARAQEQAEAQRREQQRLSDERSRELTSEFQAYTAETKQELAVVTSETQATAEKHAKQNNTLAEAVARAKIKAAAKKAAEDREKNVGLLAVTSLDSANGQPALKAAQPNYRFATPASIEFEYFEIVTKKGEEGALDEPMYNPNYIDAAGTAAAVQEYSQRMNSLGADYREYSAIQDLRPMILKRMPKDGGVLVCITRIDTTIGAVGSQMKEHLEAFICGDGKDRVSVVKRYESQAQLKRDREGWTRKYAYAWATVPVGYELP